MRTCRANFFTVPLSRVFQSAVALRNLAFDRGLLSSSPGQLPSICVGNVVLGGSGKTPFTQFLVQELTARGESPAVLLRGYKSGIKEPHLIDVQMSAGQIGDEAALHRLHLPASVPVVISPNRLAGIALLNEQTNATLVVLDDGLQHRRIKPDVSLLLLDATNEETQSRWLQGYCPPAGYLREPLSSIEKRVDALIYIYRLSPDQVIPQHQEYASSLPCFRFVLRPKLLIDCVTKKSHPLSYLCDRQIRAACAIANPQPFFDTLQAIGANITKKYVYRDHHSFSEEERRELLTPHHIPLVITEKDAVKLSPWIAQAETVFALTQSGDFASAEEKVLFWQLAQRKLAQRLETTETGK